MNKKYLIIIISVITLTGCVPEEEPCNTKYSYDHDMVGEAGLMLAATSEAFITFDKMDTLYKEVQSCLNLTAPAPTVKYKNFRGGWGLFIAPNSTIWINEDVGIAPRNCHSDRETLRHEFVHHLLYANYSDATHASPEFARCGALGVDTCNGVPCATGSYNNFR